MMLLDRYLVREFTRWFGLILSVFVLMYLLVDFFGRLRMFLSNNALPSQMAAYFLYNLPMIVSLTLPAAVLVATLLTLGTLSRHSEIIAMKACGVSLYRVFLPIVLCAGALSIFNFLNGEFLVPEANQRVEQIKRVEIQKKEPRGTFKRNELWYRGERGSITSRSSMPEPGPCTASRSICSMPAFASRAASTRNGRNGGRAAGYFTT